VRADQRLRANALEYRYQGETLVAEGEVHYADAAQAFYADRVEAQLAKNETRAENVRYALRAQRGQGRAAVAIAKGRSSSFEGVSYTTCSGDQPDWEIAADAIEIDHEAGIGHARDFRLRLGGVPVLYVPRASFPIDDRRKSGFLAPRIGGGSDGIDLAAPYYLNLASNYDATLVPRWIGDRGFQAGGEFRYLYAQGYGQFDGEWLPGDERYGDDRARVRFQHHGRLLPGVRLDADLNHVSDDRYFVDLGDSLSGSSTSVLGSVLALSGGGRLWHWSVLADAYELILPEVEERAQHDPYARRPRIAFGFDQRPGPWRYGTEFEWVYFRRDPLPVFLGNGSYRYAKVTEGRRLDLQPYLGWSLEPSWGHLRARASLRHTRYQLERGPGSPCSAAGCGKQSPTRTTPILSADAGLLFERANAFGQGHWRQTLEPRLYALYVPTREQSALPVFDSAALDSSFAQLFRDNRYSGADRQADAQQLSVALSSRLLDHDSGAELAAVQIGQAFYFQRPQVYLPEEADPFLVNDRRRSAWVIEARAALGQWNFNAAYRRDPERQRSDFGAFRLSRRFGADGLLNLGYRYRPDQPLWFGDPAALGTRIGLEQAEVSALLPFTPNWRGVMRWNYSLREDTTLEAIAGFEYASCCYSVRLLSRNYLRGVGSERRNAIYLEVELRGLGSLGRDTGDFLRRAILGYQPFGGAPE
jgi:LPS-assembly protein